MKKIKIVQEAFEKAKELYWEKDKAVFVGIDLRKHSDGSEAIETSVWVDQGLGKSATHVFTGKSFQELLDFLDIKESDPITDSYPLKSRLKEAGIDEEDLQKSPQELLDLLAEKERDLLTEGSDG